MWLPCLFGSASLAISLRLQSLRKPGASNRRTDPEPKGGASLCRLGFGGGDLGRDNPSGTEFKRRALRGRTRDLYPPRLYRGSTPGERRDRQSCAIGGKDPRAHGREPETDTRWPWTDHHEVRRPGRSPPMTRARDPYSHTPAPPSRAPLGQPEWQLERP